MRRFKRMWPRWHRQDGKLWEPERHRHRPIFTMMRFDEVSSGHIQKSLSTFVTQYHGPCLELPASPATNQPRFAAVFYMTPHSCLFHWSNPRNKFVWNKYDILSPCNALFVWVIPRIYDYILNIGLSILIHTKFPSPLLGCRQNLTRTKFCGHQNSKA